MSKYLEAEKIFKNNQDPENAVNMENYMRNRFKFYGIKTPLRKKLFREFIKSEKKSQSIDWCFLDECYESEYREFQYLALDYLTEMKRFLSFEDIGRLFIFVKKKQWWDTIDRLDRIIGDIGLLDKRMDQLMLDWSEDPDFWVRRIAIDHQLIRKEKTNRELLATIILNNLGSEEFFINKAIGWSLRDYSKTDPQWVKEFIEDNRDRMSPLSIREGSKYL